MNIVDELRDRADTLRPINIILSKLIARAADALEAKDAKLTELRVDSGLTKP